MFSVISFKFFPNPIIPFLLLSFSFIRSFDNKIILDSPFLSPPPPHPPPLTHPLPSPPQHTINSVTTDYLCFLRVNYLDNKLCRKSNQISNTLILMSLPLCLGQVVQVMNCQKRDLTSSNVLYTRILPVFS